MVNKAYYVVSSIIVMITIPLYVCTLISINIFNIVASNVSLKSERAKSVI